MNRPENTGHPLRSVLLACSILAGLVVGFAPSAAADSSIWLESATSSSLTVGWSAPPDVGDFEVHVGGVQHPSTDNSFATVWGLSAGTEYHVKIEGYGDSGKVTVGSANYATPESDGASPPGDGPAGTGPPPLCQGVVATIWGTDGDDVLTGTDGRDVIQGGWGNDVIDGKAGNDLICGGGYHDVIRGGRGNDEIVGGPGSDTIFGGPGNDTIKGGLGDDSINGGSGDDIINSGQGRNRVVGKGGVDTIDGISETVPTEPQDTGRSEGGTVPHPGDYRCSNGRHYHVDGAGKYWQIDDRNNPKSCPDWPSLGRGGWAELHGPRLHADSCGGSCQTAVDEIQREQEQDLEHGTGLNCSGCTSVVGPARPDGKQTVTTTCYCRNPPHEDSPSTFPPSDPDTDGLYTAWGSYDPPTGEGADGGDGNGSTDGASGTGDGTDNPDPGGGLE